MTKENGVTGSNFVFIKKPGETAINLGRGVKKRGEGVRTIAK